ncbi:MAG: hypothetical protein FJ087_15735 [Deltaproteobacteria bacterium]|nr:hypothetical protein [Deltaproteobacteria bacterium]
MRLATTIGIAAVVLAGRAALAQPCGTVGDAGCCGSGVVKFCEGGTLQTLDCTKNGPLDEKVCGWWEEYGYYDCGGLGGDPSKKNPYLCPGLACTSSCANKECGSDGCDGTCGSCTGGRKCGPDFKCADLPDCQGIPFAGCCDGDFSRWCEKGYLHQSDCTGRPPCGWKGDPGNGVYDCGFTGADPSGKFPQDCAFYLPKPEPEPEPQPDSSPDPVPDAAADAVADAPPAGDFASDPGTGGGGGGGGGCGAGAAAGWAGALLLLPFPLLRRRRD